MIEIGADVVVCGGGASGLPAALSAAREGMKVVIIEEDAFIGGAVTDYGIRFYCGGPLHGIHLELENELKKIDHDYNRYNCFRSSSYRLVWDKLMDGLPIMILCCSTVRAVESETREGVEKITAVLTDTHRVSGKVFVEATGTGDLAVKTACRTRIGREAAGELNETFAPEKGDHLVQMCTQMYTLKRIAADGNDMKPSWAAFNNEEYLIWGPTFPCEDTTNRFELSEIQRLAVGKLRCEAEPEWKNKGFMISEIAPKIGMREARRIVGQYTLCEGDLMVPRRFEDAVMVAQYPIDPWDPEGNPFHDNKKREKCNTPVYEIPYRSFVCNEVGNLIAAGRCISGTHVAMSSYRVMAICEVTGQIAGIAASVSVKGGTDVNELSVLSVRKIVKRYGVITNLDDDNRME